MQLLLLTVLGTAAVCCAPAISQAQQSPTKSAQVIKQKKSTQSSAAGKSTDATERSDSATAKSSGSAGKLMIMEFGDLQCPDTAAFAADIRQQIISNYVSTGRASYSFHDFPLDAHPMAARAAEIARCAGNRTDALRQQFLTNQMSVRSEEDMFAMAQQAGMDPAALKQCLASGSSAAAVQKDRALGQQYGVRATPSLALGYMGANGQFTLSKVIRGDRPMAQVKSEIDAALQGAPQ